MKTYERIFDAARRASNPDAEKTLKGFQRRAGIIRGALKEARKRYLADLDELRQTYTAKALEERQKPLDAEYNELVSFAKQRLVDDCEAVLAAKRDWFSKCSGAPSAEALRLLQALQMRSSISASEIQYYAQVLSGNIPAMRVLREIARKNKIPFPDVGSAEAFEEQLTLAREYVLEMLEAVGEADDKELNYRQRSFWLYPDAITEADGVFGDLDNTFFSAPQKTDLEAAEKASGETIEPGKKPNAVRIFLRGDESLATISAQFGVSSSEIRAYNPDYDFANMNHGDNIVVPSGRLRISNAAGSIVEGQCIPVYAEKPAPAPKSGTEIVIE